MSYLLQPFTVAEQESLRVALAILHETHFFGRIADKETINLASRWASVPNESKISEMDRLTGIRTTLLYLASESAEIWQGVQDSRAMETMNEEAVE